MAYRLRSAQYACHFGSISPGRYGFPTISSEYLSLNSKPEAAVALGKLDLTGAKSATRQSLDAPAPGSFPLDSDEHRDTVGEDPDLPQFLLDSTERIL